MMLRQEASFLGVERFARCEIVPDVLHVETEFFHAGYFPLIPLGSFAIVKQHGELIEAPIPLAWKSVALAWFRDILLAVLVILGCLYLLDLDDPRAGAGRTALILIAVVVGLVTATYLIPGIRRATLSRAREIGLAIDLTETGMLRIEAAFDQVSAAEVDESLPSILGTIVRTDGMNVFVSESGASAANLTPSNGNATSVVAIHVEGEILRPPDSEDVDGLRDTYAIPLLEVLNEQGETGAVFELRLNSERFALVDAKGQVVDEVSDREQLADVLFPSFIRSQQFLTVPFFYSLRNFKIGRSDARTLRSVIEQEIVHAHPEAAGRIRQGGIHAIWSGILMMLVAAAVFLVLLAGPILLICHGLFATGLAVVIRGIADCRRSKRLSTQSSDSRLDEVALESLTKGALPGTIAQSLGPQEDLPTVRRRTQLAGLSTLCLIGSFTVLCYTVAALHDDWRLGEKEPFYPDPIEFPPVPALPVELPVEKDVILVSAESGELKLVVDDLFCINDWWDALDPVMQLGSREITGRPLDHTPVARWARELQVIGSLPTSHAEAIARFEIDFNKQELHRVTPFEVKMQAFVARLLKRGVFGPEDRLLKTSGSLFAVSGEEWEQLQKRESLLNERRRQRHFIENCQADWRTYNNAIDRAVQTNRELRPRRKFWLFVSLGIAVCGIGLGVFVSSPVRAGFNTLLAAGIVFCLSSSVLTETAPEKLKPVEMPAELENLPPPVPGLAT